MAMVEHLLTAGSRSSKAPATRAESRSRPRVSWVMSLEPIEKPSKCSRKCVGVDGVGRHLAHHHDLQVVLAAAQAVLGRAGR